MTHYPEVSTQELTELIGKPNVHIVDVRQADAYNGWPLNGEVRGGHIKGARSLPLKWTSYMDWIEIVRAKGILPHHTLVLYSYHDDNSIQVAELFAKAGYTHIHIYKNLVKEWTTNTSLPMDALPRYQQLVPASWVKQVVDCNTPAGLKSDNVVIVHAHYRNRDAYLSGHIPGAIDMDTLALEAPETWNRRLPEELKKAFESHGITADTTVVVYGKFMWPDNMDEFPGSAAGHLGAIRCCAIMLYAGVKDVRVLNGGFQSWKDAGYEISTDDVPKRAVADFGAEIPANPHFFVDTPQAKEMIADADADIVSVRSWEEYIGKVSGYNYIEKKGRIPGSIFGNCGSDAYHMENYRNLDHTIREAGEISNIWREAGIVADKRLAFYCGTGWRGSEAFYNAWLMGWPTVSVYDGGWFEWSNAPDNPCETGIPGKN
ncbi:thiosulfate sulfurtransferase [Carboxylicivirga mesophila]|uniref:Sulfurtransferase n=1 Tax=Carboxylicivirga mesophila TaxID=1166478 RepID=A0ABS5KB49_9BACT|nr:rhodanese-like domain-containing protein [Carboxylicivirga mesophila]MBS2212200.1 thiosulfate sulfurtransferase [Carboxylicivirga mesophila]